MTADTKTLRERLFDCETSLRVWDESRSSEYWLKYPAAIDLMAETPLQSSGAGIKWTYCPECGCDQFKEAHDGERECSRCKQSWYADIDYTNAVRSNLSERSSPRGVTEEKELRPSTGNGAVSQPELTGGTGSSGASDPVGRVSLTLKQLNFIEKQWRSAAYNPKLVETVFAYARAAISSLPRSGTDELVEALKTLYRAYIRTLEAERDRIRSLGGDCDSVEKMEASDPVLCIARNALSNAKGGK